VTPWATSLAAIDDHRLEPVDRQLVVLISTASTGNLSAKIRAQDKVPNTDAS
jgi:hypothetical protein